MSRPTQTKWEAFWKRHGNQNYTPFFNGHLEAIIEDAGADLAERVRAWIIRQSWGNHTDACVDSQKGFVLTQADCARKLSEADPKKPIDRRKVHPVFAKLKKDGYVTFGGILSQITPLDAPGKDARFALSTPRSEPFETISEDQANTEALPAFVHFREHILPERQPETFRAYQEIEKARKENSLAILEAWKAYKRELSETVRTNEPEPSETVRTPKRKRSDNAGETGRTIAEPILIGSKQDNIKGASSSGFSTSRKSFDRHAPIDDDGFNGLVAACKRHHRTITDDELKDAINEAGERMSRPRANIDNPRGYLLTTVERIVSMTNYKDKRAAHREAVKATNEMWARQEREREQAASPAERIAALEQYLEAFPRHAEADEWRAELARLQLKSKKAGA